MVLFWVELLKDTTLQTIQPIATEGEPTLQKITGQNEACWLPPKEQYRQEETEFFFIEYKFSHKQW
jgi:hypothetical protein